MLAPVAIFTGTTLFAYRLETGQELLTFEAIVDPEELDVRISLGALFLSEFEKKLGYNMGQPPYPVFVARKNAKKKIALAPQKLGENWLVKASFLAILTIFGILALRTPEVRAQLYYSYPYWEDPQYQYWQYQNYLQWQQYLDYLRQTDPYYDLHIMHYQLYLGPYQPYQIYPPCCFLPPWPSGYRPRWGMSGSGHVTRPRPPGVIRPRPPGRPTRK